MDEQLMMLMMQQLLFGQQQAQQQVQGQQGFGIEDVLSLLGTDTALPSATSRAQINPIERGRQLLATPQVQVDIGQPEVVGGPNAGVPRASTPGGSKSITGNVTDTGSSVMRGTSAAPVQVGREDGELMQMALSILMDPDIKADDVGSQLMQMITIDSLTGNKRKGNTPQGISGFLKNILASMETEQAPQAGRR